MEQDQKQMISVSLELFNKMFSTLVKLPFEQINSLIVEIQQEMQATQVVEEPKTEEK